LSCTRDALRRPLVCDPGSAWVYGTSTDWVGLMVEAASGDALDVYLARHVTGPLGMRDTRFCTAPDLDARLAALHSRDDRGAWAPMPFSWPEQAEMWNAGHRLHGSAADYGRFLQMLLNQGSHAGTRLLEPRTVELICENHIGDLMVTCLESVAPAFVCDAEFQPGTRKKHGLAAMLSCEQLPGRRAPGSGCWAGVFNTFFWFDPAHGIGAVLMTQTLPFADPAVMGLLDAFEEAIYADLAA
jgi:CubicO group peptidase (beta-lactamase class C family)